MKFIEITALEQLIIAPGPFAVYARGLGPYNRVNSRAFERGGAFR